MATRADYLAEIAGRSYILAMSTPVLIETGPTNVNHYSVMVCEKSGTDKATTIRFEFGVYREGLSGETAFGWGEQSGYVPFYKENKTMYVALKNYLDGFSGLLGWKILEINDTQVWADVLVWVNNVGRKRYFVYKKGSDPIAYQEFTA